MLIPEVSPFPGSPNLHFVDRTADGIPILMYRYQMEIHSPV